MLHLFIAIVSKNWFQFFECECALFFRSYLNVYFKCKIYDTQTYNNHQILFKVLSKIHLKCPVFWIAWQNVCIVFDTWGYFFSLFIYFLERYTQHVNKFVNKTRNKRLFVCENIVVIWHQQDTTRHDKFSIVYKYIL